MIVRKGSFLFHVGIGQALIFPDQQRAIERILSEAGDWLRYSANCWLVYGPGPIQAVAERLRSVPGMAAITILVVDLGVEYTGYMTPEAWDWIKKYQGL
jgi:hypothetical protein